MGQGDLDRLLHAIADGFGGTGPPLPGDRRTTVWYLETGFQTTVPRAKKRYYSGEETDSFVVPPVAPEDAEPWVRDQARQLHDALLLARCQPSVGAFFNFELGSRAGSPACSGGTERRSRRNDAFKDAVALVRSGRVDCATVAGVAGAPLPPEKPRPSGLGIR